MRPAAQRRVIGRRVTAGRRFQELTSHDISAFLHDELASLLPLTIIHNIEIATDD